jgi:hypothetical protein
VKFGVPGNSKRFWPNFILAQTFFDVANILFLNVADYPCLAVVPTDLACNE